MDVKYILLFIVCKIFSGGDIAVPLIFIFNTKT